MRAVSATLLLLSVLTPLFFAHPALAEPGAVLDATEIKRLEPGGHACAITFDDGPGKYTPALLDLLKERGIHATFFVLGMHVEKAADTVRRIAAEGHEIDNHSYDHPLLRHLTEAQQKQEMDRTELALKALGVIPHFFRPPYGSYDSETVRAAAEDNLVLALWSVDSLDWKYHTVKGIEAQVLPKGHIEPRGIFLFHDIHRTTVRAMPDVLEKLAQAGCRFVTLSEWLAEER